MAALPHSFTSRQQLDEYIRCLRNIKVGDELEYYVDSTGWHHSKPTNYTDRATVIVACKNPEIELPDWPKVWTMWNWDPSTRVPLIVLGSNNEKFPTHHNWVFDIRALITKSNTHYTRSQHLLSFGLLVKQVIHK